MGSCGDDSCVSAAFGVTCSSHGISFLGPRFVDVLFSATVAPPTKLISSSPKPPSSIVSGRKSLPGFTV